MYNSPLEASLSRMWWHSTNRRRIFLQFIPRTNQMIGWLNRLIRISTDASYSRNRLQNFYSGVGQTYPLMKRGLHQDVVFYKDRWNSFQVWPTWTVVAKNPVTDPPPIYPTDQPNDRLIKSFDSDFNRRLLKSEPFTKFVFRGGTNVSIDEEESSLRCSFL